METYVMVMDNVMEMAMDKDMEMEMDSVKVRLSKLVFTCESNC